MPLSQETIDAQERLWREWEREMLVWKILWCRKAPELAPILLKTKP
jgi:hypothetical protein